MIFEFAIIVSAFTLQLLALPGEKAQFIISALSTKYKPIPIVLGASAAFGIWTIVEIWVGTQLKGALPGQALEVSMAILLVLFGLYLLYDAKTQHSENTSIDESKYFKVISDRVPEKVEGAVTVFLIIFIGEFGDKTQIITIGLAAQYGARPEIWIGEMLAIIPISLLNAFAVSKFSSKYSSNKVKYGAAVILFLFAFDIALSQLVGWSFLPL